jgi:DNA-binding transcriptional ArsR family regulator
MNIKQSISNDELRVKIFKALADENRLAIVRLLHENHDNMEYGKLSAAFNVGKSTISYHLKIMHEAGLITFVRHGQSKDVQLNKMVFDGVLPGFLATL